MVRSHDNMPPSLLMARRKGIGPGLKVDCVSIAPAALSGNHCDVPRCMGDTYDVHERIGSGNFSVVYRAVHRSNNGQVALKVVRTLDEEVVAIAKAEFSLLQRIQHPNIVRALDFAAFPDRVVLTLSYFGGEQLGTAVRRVPGNKLPEVTAHGLFVALVQALDYLHQREIVHRDVNPQNVMVSCDFTELLLIDFNIARHLAEDGVSTPVCVPTYAPPEVRNGGPPSAASDVWGAGLCLRMMLSGKCRAIPSTSVSEPCMDVLGQCLEAELSLRADTATLLQTAWVRSGATLLQTAVDQAQKLLVTFPLSKDISSEAPTPSTLCASEDLMF